MGERGLDDIEGAEIVNLELIAHEIHSLSRSGKFLNCPNKGLGEGQCIVQGQVQQGRVTLTCTA